MTTSRIKEKLSKVVSSQLPEHIQASYPTFVAFIEAYYRFLEQDQSAFEVLQNARSYGDLDSTLESFIVYFLKNYASDLPTETLADKKLLIKKIKDLYEAKGSSLSFKLLFNLLYAADVELNYPHEFVLRASDGRWQQKNSIRVEYDVGQLSDILFRNLKYVKSGVEYNLPILETKSLTSNIGEVFLDITNFDSTFNLGDRVEVLSNSNIIFSGNITPTTTNYTIVESGVGFKNGQIYTVNYSPGVGTVIQVSNVNASGAINKIKFINYGYGFNYPPTFFSVRLYPGLSTAITSEDVKFSSTRGFSESVTVISFDPSSPSRYFFSDYTSNTYTVSDANTSTVTSAVFDSAVSGSDGSCLVTFQLGSLGRYPGSFSVNKGFLSEPEICLQDDKLYQPFAYQTITEVDYNKFFNVVKKLVHPAGQNLFNNRTISSAIDITGNIVVSGSANIFAEAVDSIEAFDFDISKTIFKFFNSEYSLAVDNFNVELDAIKDELAINIEDSVVISLGQDYSDPTYFAEYYITGPSVTA